jgi:ribonucleoside-diphosphate reductase alpha chain
MLAEKGKDTEETWTSITVNEGSVQHLDFLTQDEKDVFKTAFELDQRWVIELAADRTPYIDQSQSVNIFLSADVHKRDLHQIHYQAWKQGMKSLYYCRSKSIQRAEDVSTQAPATQTAKGINVNMPLPGVPSIELPLAAQADDTQETTDYEECLACQ